MVRKGFIILLSIVLGGMAIFWVLRRTNVSLLSFLPEFIRAIPELVFLGFFVFFGAILLALILHGRKREDRA